MNKDQFKGKAKITEGELQESAGKIVDNDDMKQKGKLKKASGKVQSVYGDLKEKVKKS